jgi:PhzF family phenazine biosynthesis protein
LRTVDAFTDKPFTGNPAAVVMLDDAPPDDWMAAVARETNMSDTAFVIRETLADADFRLRWFTPALEVDLCGHATLASAHCLFEDGVRGPIRFATRSGVLTVSRRPDGSLAMDFPAWPPAQVEFRAAAAEALGVPVEWTGRSDNNFFLMAVVADEHSVRNLTPMRWPGLMPSPSSSLPPRARDGRTTSSRVSLRRTLASTRIPLPAVRIRCWDRTGAAGSVGRHW